MPKENEVRNPDAPTLTTDVLNISGSTVPALDAVTEQLLDRGKSERVMILAGTEGGKGRKPYAITKIEIEFNNETDLRNCVRMLRWSDERLRARPEQMILWDWQQSFREGMKIHFGVAWYDREFFDRRKDAFKEPTHIGYYTMFGATPERFKMHHEIIEFDTPNRAAAAEG
jgi:hypothetical protein